MRRAVAAAAAAGALAFPAAAAGDTGRWVITRTDSVPSTFRQGLTSNPRTDDVFFSGSFAGLYRTRELQVKDRNTSPIPADVQQRERYNHIGDIAWDPREGGRLLLPLESYAPFEPDQNPSKTGSIGVMDARTLTWRYYVKLDPAEIPKAQWLAVDPMGLVWTISGSDLLAYNLVDVNPANAAPNAAPIHAVKRLAGVAPDGAGGAAFYRGRLYLSTLADGVNRLISVNTTTGATRVEYRRPGNLEPEGLDSGPYFGGILHWELVPGGGLSNAQVLNMVPKGARLRLSLSQTHLRAHRRVRIRAKAVVVAGSTGIPLAGVRVRLGRAVARTNRRGRARLSVALPPGRYRAIAFYKKLRTGTSIVRVRR